MEENALLHVQSARVLAATNVSKNVKPAKRTTVAAVKKNAKKTNARNYTARSLTFYVLCACSLIAQVVVLTVIPAKRSSV
jgi:hypothetical protein